MSSDPRELAPLLAAEVERRLPILEDWRADLKDVRAALHSLKGSAAMAGESDLSLIIGQLATRIKRGDEDARRRAVALLRRAHRRLESGATALAERWPVPPGDLTAVAVDEKYAVEYASAMRARLEELDRAVAGDDPPDVAAERARRAIHTMKGAAMGLDDEALVWFLHGLEAALTRAEAGTDGVRGTLAELQRHRAALSMFVADPGRGLHALRARAPSEPPSAPPRGPGPRSVPPEADDSTALKVRGEAINRLLDRVERAELARDRLAGDAERVHDSAAAMREVRARLVEALRLIGPPKPWGAPAAALDRIAAATATLGDCADALDQSSSAIRTSAERLHADAGATRADLAALRRTQARWLFDRIEASIKTVAAAAGRDVAVRTSGEHVPIHRRTAESLLDPLLQLARNAVAHGIRSPEERIAAGKPARGTVLLSAERRGDWLRFVVADDGAGVDLPRLRKALVDRGLVSETAAENARPGELLGLLFIAGVTTTDRGDALAGRGVGLDVVQDAVRKLGGSAHLARHELGGVAATIQVPSEGNVAEVVWIEAGGSIFALPVGFTGEVSPGGLRAPTVHLSRCLGVASPQAHRLALELRVEGVATIRIGIDELGAIEEATIRPLPILVASAGPYSGAVLRGDGSLRLVLDATRLAARAWANLQ